MIQTILLFLALSFVSPALLAQGVKTVSLSEGFLPTAARLDGDYMLRLPFSVPENFVKRDVPQQPTAIWGTPEDVDLALQSGSLAHSKNGLFTLKISMGVAYNEATKSFSFEDEFSSKGTIDGVKDLVVRRSEAQGFALASVTGKIENKRIFLQYVALGEAALLVNYYHADPFTAKDQENWDRFVSDLQSRSMK